MSNTTKKTSTVIIVAIFMAATLVVGIGTTLAVTTTQSAYAAGGKKDNGKGGNGNGNTITIQKCKQEASESGFDNDQEQECENLICTHPGNNATCTEEGAAVVTPVSTQAPITCEQCFTTILTPQQLTVVLGSTPISTACVTLSQITQAEERSVLISLGIPSNTVDNLIACLLKAGVVFAA